MENNTDDFLRNAIQGIFSKNSETTEAKKKFVPKDPNGASQKDLEVALTVLLVDLASCDQNFDPQEYHIITNGLRRLFGTTKSEVTALVNQANVTLQQLRGVGRFATLLKDNLEHEQKQAIMEVIEEVISADNEEDGFETYLRNKLAGMLGMPVATPPAQEETDSH
jgi:uncharacterized tellurite resistance protein B-like protein